MEFSTIEKIKWKFNPPTAAWWGGFWERLVRMVKELLRRVLGSKTVSYIELETILCDCEATMNSRPLTYLEDGTAELKPLTPAYFIQGIPHHDVKDLDTIDSKSLNRRLRYLQNLRIDLRSRFRNEYLAMLVHRRERKGDTLEVGDVVLIGTPEKRINWPLGLVVQVFPGADGHVRVAKVKTADGEKITPVHNLYPLEVTRPSELPQHFQPQISLNSRSKMRILEVPTINSSWMVRLIPQG
ncbi:uncharacterized protein LOC118190200 [Stegodyphus dumicola]|uniref:uncharacterized protein LOC118190200 n=1 Tax=Stegodyphus dumicola TaxID=202533 RepID=UPI0015B2F37B|nr:uncharacterized protein LOC118190200 [Stegodyphus dumicola]